MNNTVIKFEGVSKKFRKSLRQSMIYGFKDITKNTFGIPAKTEVLRKGEFWALDNVSFEVKKGETLGIIGPNGAGKTTILKLIAGILYPDKGKVEVNGKVGSLIEIGAGFHPLLTGRENIYVNGAILGMSKKEIDEKIDDIIEFADIGDFIDTPVKYYSSGMYVRLGFSIAIHSNPDILLVDEVLAVGDEEFQRKCFNKIGELRNKGITIAIVSHNLHIISLHTQNTLLVNKGKIKYFDNPEESIEEYTNLFTPQEEWNLNIEKVCSGNKNINIFDVKIHQNVLSPLDSFFISLFYNSKIDYEDVEIDTVILSNKDNSIYFQATNKAYDKKINLPAGKHCLKEEIQHIPINNAVAKISIAIWSKDKKELLFWWKIPVKFKKARYSTSKNFLTVQYEIE